MLIELICSNRSRNWCKEMLFSRPYGLYTLALEGEGAKNTGAS